MKPKESRYGIIPELLARTALSIACMALPIGCENSGSEEDSMGSSGADSDAEFPSDPTLLSVAHEQARYLAKVFALSEPNWDNFEIHWGCRSCIYPWDDWNLVTIDRHWQGNAEITRAHVRHELFHLMSGFWINGTPEFCNGVRIADHVAWKTCQ